MVPLIKKPKLILIRLVTELIETQATKTYKNANHRITDSTNESVGFQMRKHTIMYSFEIIKIHIL